MIVDQKARTIGRQGFTVTVTLSMRPKLWHIFWVLFQAGIHGSTKVQLTRNYAGESDGSALRNQKRELNNELIPLGIEVQKRAWKLVAYDGSDARSDNE